MTIQKNDRVKLKTQDYKILPTVAGGMCIGGVIGGFATIALAAYIRSEFHISDYLQVTTFIWLGITGISFVIWRIIVLFNKYNRFL